MRELEPEPRDLRERAAEAVRETRALDDEEERARPTRERADPPESIGRLTDAGAHLPRANAGAEIEDDEVDGPSLEERAGHPERLVERVGNEDDESVEPDAACDGLDGIERSPEVHPGRQRAGSLGLGDESERESRRAARGDAADRDRAAERHTAGTQDRVERGEAGRDDVATRLRGLARLAFGKRNHGEGAVDLGLVRPQVTPDPPRSCCTPARPKGRESGADVRGGGRHGRSE